ncbi:hypothetical protein [Sphingomonas sp.]|uniref:hypothetical protein n=1 Tax=Sphingomonas sp. TaxID=28214 RepID=UPI0025D60C6C|nr:hypothetical protein [Sphingomonas sp.]
MSRRRIAIAGFVLATLLLVWWLFANWYVWSMASFDCADLVSSPACEESAHRRVTIQIFAAIAAWAVLAWLTFRNWGKQ